MLKLLKKKSFIAAAVLLAAMLIIASQSGFFRAAASDTADSGNGSFSTVEYEPAEPEYGYYGTGEYEPAEPEYGYFGTGTPTNFSETVTYTSRTVTGQTTVVSAPTYYSRSDSDCAPVSGAIIAGYYDYTCPNLIPDYTAVFFYNGVYYTSAQNDKVNTVISSLYSSMGTTVANGTTVNGFKAGLTSYVQSRGYSIGYTSVMSGSSFNMNSYVSQINSGRAVALFINTFKYTESALFWTTDNTDYIYGIQSSSRHTCVGVGYRTISYYNASGNFRTDTYLLVSMGNGTSGYLNLNNQSIVEDALSVYIS